MDFGDAIILAARGAHVTRPGIDGYIRAASISDTVGSGFVRVDQFGVTHTWQCHGDDAVAIDWRVVQ